VVAIFSSIALENYGQYLLRFGRSIHLCPLAPKVKEVLAQFEQLNLLVEKTVTRKKWVNMPKLDVSWIQCLLKKFWYWYIRI
jgi:hypothetical protein